MPTLRRLYKQGSSVVVSIPKWMLEMMGVAVGDFVSLTVGHDGHVDLCDAELPEKEDDVEDPKEP